MCLLVTIGPILATAAFVKYLLFNGQGGKHEVRSDDKHGFEATRGHKYAATTVAGKPA
jgi:hypothetical protein